MRGCKPLSDAEVSSAYNSITGNFQARNRALFLLGLSTGLRASSLVALTLGDVYSFTKCAPLDTIYIRRCTVKGKGAGYTVPVLSQAKEALMLWLGELAANGDFKPDTFLFQSRKGVNQAIDRRQAWRILDQAFKSAGIEGKTGTHSMRKTFAANAYEAFKGEIVKLQLALGHSDLNNTAIYLSFKDEEITQGLRSMKPFKLGGAA